VCKKKNIPDVNLICGTFPEAIPEGRRYNLVTMFDTLEHIEDDLGTLKKVNDVLLPKGYIICTIPAFQFLWSHHDIMNQHKRRYTKKSFEEKVIKAGFKTIRISYFNTILFLPAVLVRFYREWLSPHKLEHSDVGITKNRAINALLSRIFALERFLLRSINLPFGLSIIYVGEKI
jgi:SAM-dependent methyltransferase